MSIDFNKPVQTRDGREARIYAQDAGGLYPIHGAVRQNSSSEPWRPESWMADGRYYSHERHVGHSGDLVNTPPPKPLPAYINVYTNGTRYVSGGIVHTSRAEADKEARRDRVGCVRIEAERWDD